MNLLPLLLFSFASCQGQQEEHEDPNHLVKRQKDQGQQESTPTHHLVKRQVDLGQQEGPPAHHLVRRQVDLGNVYDWFTSADTQRNFFVTLTSQLVWTSLGLVLGHGVWQAVRGEAKVSSDPDLASLVDFILNDEIATENVGINIGYFVFGNLAYIGLSLLGDPARRRKSHTGSIADKQEQGDPLLDTLDRVFGLNFALTSVLVATINYAAFMAFWAAMSLLPARSRRRRSDDWRPRDTGRDLHERVAPRGMDRDLFLETGFLRTSFKGPVHQLDM